MPPAIIGSKSVQLIGDHEADSGEKRGFVDAGGDEHRLQALGCGQQDVWWITEYGGLVGLAYVAVPEGARTADQGCVPAEPYLDIVQQGADGADVEDAGGGEIDRKSTRLNS